ncbi:hypothetical protein FWK35_00008020 [Aphis craccivora]|uniref:Uncharacterized protein n=1 Tax=Aphis craccivora TaxID=307492 RepID=A0A6G0YME7_APHCR|nr:hypothetical protein FWK35_00008020 [Aphis craccivora]
MVEFHLGSKKVFPQK